MTTRSQCSRIIDYLATGHAVTPLEALRRWGCFRLGARIWDLRRDGHTIKATLIQRGGKRFAQYRLAR